MTRREVGSLCCNGVVFCLALFILLVYPEDTLDVSLYANIGTYIALVASGLMFVMTLVKKELSNVPFWTILLKYVSSVLNSLTFVVALVHTPVTYGLMGYVNNMLLGINLFRHVLIPLLSAVSFMFFEGDRRLNKKKTMWYPVLCTLCYVVIIVGLVSAKMISAPYVFFNVYLNPIYVSIIWFVCIMLTDYLLARYMLLVNQMKAPRIKLKR